MKKKPPLPFHKKNWLEWSRALTSKNSSERLIKELVQNCGFYPKRPGFLYRCRKNLKSNEDRGWRAFDSPPLNLQENHNNRFQLYKKECLYLSGSEKTALMETLSTSISMDDSFSIAELKIEKPLKLLNLANNQRASGNTSFNYKGVTEYLFLSDFPEHIALSRKLAQIIHDADFDGITYISKREYDAGLKNRSYSVSYNHLIFGSPLAEGKLAFVRLISNVTLQRNPV